MFEPATKISGILKQSVTIQLSWYRNREIRSYANAKPYILARKLVTACRI